MAGRWQTKISVEVGKNRGAAKEKWLSIDENSNILKQKMILRKKSDLRCLSPSAVEVCAQMRRLEPLPTQGPRQVYSNKEKKPVIKSNSSRKNLKTVNLWKWGKQKSKERGEKVTSNSHKHTRMDTKGDRSDQVPLQWFPYDLMWLWCPTIGM